jgi:death on curing protein
MSFHLLTPAQVEAIHDLVLNPGERTGRARVKSLQGALGRVDNRLSYGLIGDVFALAAAYAAAISQGHCFNDDNKRTAYRTMLICLTLNGQMIRHETAEMGDLIIALARRRIDEPDLADWLRARAG